MANIVCCTGMWCSVVLVSTTVLEEHSAFVLYNENGGSVLLQDVGTRITEYTLLYPITPVLFKLFHPWNPLQTEIFYRTPLLFLNLQCRES